MTLQHISVVDLCCDLGGYAGALLARLGAQVAQLDGEAPADAGERAMVRRGKRLVHVAEAARLIASADIVLRGPEALPAPIAVALGWQNPSRIEVAILPFDRDGANAGRPATDFTLMARSGLMTIIGDPDRPPLTMPGRQAWALAGIQGAIAALTALHARGADGIGQTVWVSAYRSAVLANYREPLTWDWAGRVGNRTGNLLVRGKSGVRQVWPCIDGYVTWALVDNPPMMRATVAQMAADDAAGVLSEVGWDNVLVADAPRELIKQWEALVAAWLATKDRATLTRLSNKHGMGLSAIDAINDVFASAHLATRGLWQDDVVDGISVRVPGPLFREVAP